MALSIAISSSTDTPSSEATYPQPSRMPSQTTPRRTVTNAKEVLLIATSTTIPGRILLAAPTCGICEVIRTIFSAWHPRHAVLDRG